MSKHSFSIQDQKKKKKREKQQQRYKWARVGDVKAKNLAFFNQKKKTSICRVAQHLSLCDTMNKIMAPEFVWHSSQ